MGYGFGMGLFGLIPLILIGLIIYAVVKLTQSRQGDNYNIKEKIDALEILNQRFANGEISEEEYSRKKEMLRE